MTRLVLLAAALFVAATVPAPPVAASSAPCGKAGAADFDGDGENDFAVGDPMADVQGRIAAGTVHIVYGGARKGALLTQDQPKAGDLFGWAVRTGDINGDGCLDLVVGVPYQDDGAGAAQVFFGSANGLSAGTRLMAGTRQQDAHFGWSLAVDGRYVAVGAPHQDSAVANGGAVTVLALGASGKVEASRKFDQSHPAVSGTDELGDMFGWSLTFARMAGREASDLVVGVPFENDDGPGAQQGETGILDVGEVKVITDVTTDGPYESFGLNLGGQQGLRSGRFGYSLAYRDGTLAIGAPTTAVEGKANAGVVALYDDVRGDLQRPKTVVRRASSQGDLFGFAVAIVRNRLAVGVPHANGGAAQSGVVGLFQLDGNPAGEPLRQGDKGRQPYDHFGSAVAAWGDNLLVGIPDEQATSTGAVLVFEKDRTERRALAPGFGSVPVSQGVDFGHALG